MTIGVLLSNLGTPDAPSTPAVRKYLREFLSDPHVVELPRFLWLPILYGIILPFRSPKSAKLYQKIWMSEGSPLLVYMKKLSQKLASRLQKKDIIISMGMRYGSPSLESALEKLRGVDKIIVLPLYPQYSVSTTESTADKIVEILKSWPVQPDLNIISHYYNNDKYISALAESIKKNLKTGKLLFSFHGLPQSFVDKGDPYEMQCRTTASLVAKKLNLPDDQWFISFQSRLGKAKWLMPYTNMTLQEWGVAHIDSVTVVCPGFSVDCLETLEEINIQNREIFLNAGGKNFQYVPALNDSEVHIEMLAALIEQNILSGGN